MRNLFMLLVKPDAVDVRMPEAVANLIEGAVGCVVLRGWALVAMDEDATPMLDEATDPPCAADDGRMGMYCERRCQSYSLIQHAAVLHLSLLCADNAWLVCGPDRRRFVRTRETTIA